MSDIVQLESLWKIYDVGPRGVAALGGVDMQISEGQYVAIMGHSGSGKSTLLNILGCLDKPTRGRYLLADSDVSTMTDDELSDIRNRRIGFVFQSFNLIPWLSVVQNIEVPLFYQGVPRSKRHPRSRELAELVGLGKRANHRPLQLSGGEQQRVAIARAMANDPLILLADEPTGNLDSNTTTEILELIEKLHDRGKTIIIITHEPDIAERSQRIVHLRDGRIEADKPNHTP